MTQLTDLLKEATPGPWFAVTAGMDERVYRRDGSHMNIGDGWYHPEHKADAALIVYLRNHAEAMERVIALAKRVKDFVQSDTSLLMDFGSLGDDLADALAAYDAEVGADV